MELSWSIDCPDGVLIDYLFFNIIICCRDYFVLRFIYLA